MRLIGADTPLAHITDDTALALVTALEQRRGRDGLLSPKTINRYLAVLSAVLTFHKVTLELPWRDEPEGRIHFLSRGQEDAACGAMCDDDALAIRVMVACALRPGEFFSLEPDQVELEWVRLWDTKTDHPRSIPIDPALARPLWRMVEQGRIPDEAKFYVRFKRMCAALGLPEEVCPYSLRHSGGTRLAQDRVSGPLIQKWMGHASFKTTQKYIHLNDEDLARAHAERKQQPGALGIARVA